MVEEVLCGVWKNIEDSEAAMLLVGRGSYIEKSVKHVARHAFLPAAIGKTTTGKEKNRLTDSA